MSQGPFLLVVAHDGKTETHSFHQGVVTIGRSRECDLFLPDRLISRLHCRVEREGDHFMLADAGAQNPAKLRGRPVMRAELKEGESFTVGNYEVTLAMPAVENASVDETRPGDHPRGAQDLVAFLQLARALNEERDLTRLLTQIVDAAIQICGAERGFLILGKGGEHSVEVARNFAQEEVLSPEFKISRTIANRVLATGVAELTTNAQEDDRFRDLQSVADLRLRSVLCIPIRVQTEIGGVLYVDNRLQQQVFQEREKALLLSLADHAGTAINNARAMEQLRGKQIELQAALERVDQLNLALKGQLLERTSELSQIREEISAQTLSLRSKYDYKQIVGGGRAMRAVFQLLDKYIEAEDPVLVTGESGTGKELVARAIHLHSKRGEKAFVSENCAALPESLLESELFGYMRGAFTGATSNKKGLIESATGGVLFLDEIGDMPLELQKKLLRVLQEGEVRPLGSQETVKVDVRLICATNRNLEQMVRDGEFREDLYYRLAVLPVRLPPLRDRKEDIPALVRRFLGDLQRETHGRVRISPDAMDRIVNYAWPGNVRELQNEIRRAAILCDGIILESHLSTHVREGRRGPGAVAVDDGLVPSERGTTLPDMVRELEIREIQKAFERAQSNKSRAAELLGLSRFALQRKLEKYALDADGRPTGLPPAADDLA
ncbi:MAG: sigma 54-interacting transcriptional regulator [Planctomycetes bacterium]|nr:sigma 54-interacting transcriptional regulator [Planctomycetota bacterium]MCC7398838.1 sigma 54-interacting transcriptional regulator [Planctomycetota bacterium]